MPTITLKHVQKTYLNQPILSDLDLTLPRHQITTITGKGAATLLGLITGSQRPDAGQIWFDDRLVFSHAAPHLNHSPAQRQIAQCGDFAFWPHLTLRENIAFPLRHQLSEPLLTQRITRALAQVDLLDDQNRYPGSLSAHQKQALALARSLAQQPAVLIFNDSWQLGHTLLANSLRQRLATLARQLALTTIIVTDDQVAATQLADYVVQLKHGRIQQAGTAKKLVLTAN